MPIMSLDQPHSLLTRASLLFRLRDWKDSTSWEEFYRIYRKLVYGLARRSGLSHAEAEDIVQDVFKRVAETIQNFETDPKRGSFRGWLMNLTRWRITDKFRARPIEERREAVRNDATATGTDTIDRLPDPSAGDDAIWEDEWQRNILDAALARLARRVPAKQFQAFELYARQQWPVMRVARELGINAASVYLIGHRLTKQLKAEVACLQAQLG
jgi:RNA polymerase sigma factor (sigma-70 family)